MERFQLIFIDDFFYDEFYRNLRIERLEALLNNLDTTIDMAELTEQGDVRFSCSTENYNKVEPLLQILSDTDSFYYIKED